MKSKILSLLLSHQKGQIHRGGGVVENSSCQASLKTITENDAEKAVGAFSCDRKRDMNIVTERKRLCP